MRKSNQGANMVELGDYAYPPQDEKDIKDTDIDSWNSGDNLDDIVDNSDYDGEVSEDPVEDEGDEDNLGISDDLDDDVVNLEKDLEALADSEWNDNSFDCD